MLILYIQGQDDFVRSQRYSVSAPIYACIVSEENKPMMPGRIVWDFSVTDSCYFFYSSDPMPETLALVPLDTAEDAGTWYILNLADIPTEVPEAYMLDADKWNNIKL